MNWILDTYSNVYNTAMMHKSKLPHHSAPTREIKKASVLSRFFDRG